MTLMKSISSYIRYLSRLDRYQLDSYDLSALIVKAVVPIHCEFIFLTQTEVSFRSNQYHLVKRTVKTGTAAKECTRSIIGSTELSSHAYPVVSWKSWRIVNGKMDENRCLSHYALNILSLTSNFLKDFKEKDITYNKQK